MTRLVCILAAIGWMLVGSAQALQTQINCADGECIVTFGGSFIGTRCRCLYDVNDEWIPRVGNNERMRCTPQTLPRGDARLCTETARIFADNYISSQKAAERARAEEARQKEEFEQRRALLERQRAEEPAKQQAEAARQQAEAAEQQELLKKTEEIKPVEQRQYEQTVKQTSGALDKLLQNKPSPDPDNPFRTAKREREWGDAVRALKAGMQFPANITGWICKIKEISINLDMFSDRTQSQEPVGFNPSGEYGLLCNSSCVFEGFEGQLHSGVDCPVYLLVFEPTPDNAEWLSTLSNGQRIIFDGRGIGRRLSHSTVTIVAAHNAHVETD